MIIDKMTDTRFINAKVLPLTPSRCVSIIMKHLFGIQIG